MRMRAILATIRRPANLFAELVGHLILREGRASSTDDTADWQPSSSPTGVPLR